MFIFAAFLTTVSCVSQQKSNQIFIHDPVAIHAQDGKYYLYNTGPGIPSWQSEDGVHFKSLPQALDPIPAWCKEMVPRFDGHMWAPDIIYHDGLYYLYYSVSSFGSNLSAMGVATNKSLDPKDKDFKWTDHGPVLSSVPGRDDWNAIDPNIIFDENGTPWMSFGSFWGGLKIVKLADDMLTLAEPQEWAHIAARPSNAAVTGEEAGEGAIEGPFITKREDYYYLFVSFDLCCRGENSTYNVRVGRSENVTGPYVDKDGVPMNEGGGTLIIEGDDDYYAIGHNSVYNFDGTYYMYSHGYDAHDHGRQKLLVHTLKWDAEGWPSIDQDISK